ncbi:MAG: galactokinase [Fusobacteriaceae bacterium]|jgi:galactokinase|nr:galactokinase [Fusobacteriaceae bacterium]
MIKNLLKEFDIFFGKGGTKQVFFSPGRVNLIGEHTDYNGGCAFPCALDFGTYGIIRIRNDNKCRIFSLNIKNSPFKEFHINKIQKQENEGWIAYEKGIIKVFHDHGYEFDKGFDMLMFGSIPNGAGLSSSASVELLTAVILNDLYHLNIDMIDMIKMSQIAENTYVGVQCGIMDQFAIGMGKKDNAILIDCNTLEYQYAPIKLDDASIIIGNTNKKRGLTDSKYNERRKSCEDAVKVLNDNGVKISYLGELNEKEFDQVKKFITDKEQLLRAKHAVSENQRTKEAVILLKKGNISKFGELMNKSHISLRDDYDVTGFELDTMVNVAWKSKGTIGARMTGAGFGGCTVNIVKNEYIEEFIKTVSDEYLAKTKLKAAFYIAKIGDGARKIGDY